jgi:hypothetical protein
VRRRPEFDQSVGGELVVPAGPCQGCTLVQHPQSVPDVAAHAAKHAGGDQGFGAVGSGCLVANGESALQPGTPLRQVAVDPPEPPQCPGQPQCAVAVAPFECPGEGSAQVVVIDFEPV